MTNANALEQTRIAADVRDRAVEVLDGVGLTVSGDIRIVLTRVANEGALPVGLVADTDAHDAWFRAKVQEALNDPRTPIPHEEVEARFAKRRAAALRRSAKGGA